MVDQPHPGGIFHDGGLDILEEGSRSGVADHERGVEGVDEDKFVEEGEGGVGDEGEGFEGEEGALLEGEDGELLDGEGGGEEVEDVGDFVGLRLDFIVILQ